MGAERVQLKLADGLEYGSPADLADAGGAGGTGLNINRRLPVLE